jgi:cysteine desulfurase
VTANPLILDHNATTRPAPEVVAAMQQMLSELWYNPSSIHRPGQLARQKLDLARRAAAELIGAKPRHITFVGSGTEAIDLAIRGHLLARGLAGRAAEAAGRPRATIIISPVEHIAIRELASALEREERVRVLTAELDDAGRVSAESVARLLDEHHAPDADPAREVSLVSVQWANNETGTVQPVHEIGELCRDRGVTFHCDATQWAGKMPTRVQGEGSAGAGDQEEGDWAARALAVDLLTYSPHKFHGPKGVGVLYSRPGVRTATLVHGEQELGRRGGTENIAGIVGAGVACRLAEAWLAEPERRAAAGALRDYFERELLARVPDARVNGPHGGERDRLWNTSSIGFPRLEAEALLLLLSERGIACSAGAACSSGSLEASPVLRAMKIDPVYAHGTLRFSISRETTREEIDRAVPIIAECVGRLKQSMSQL